MDTFIVLEYIKSAIDIILNLKFEEIEHRLNESKVDNNATSHKHNSLATSKEQSKSLAGCENVFSPKLARELLSGSSSP